MKFSERQFDEVLAMPVGVGVYVYRSGEHEVSMLQAKRTEIEVYHQDIHNKTRKNDKAASQTICALAKALVIGAFGLFLLLLGAR